MFLHQLVDVMVLALLDLEDLHLGRCREMQGDVGRCCEVWGDVAPQSQRSPPRHEGDAGRCREMQ